MVVCFGFTGTYFIFALIFSYQTGAIKRLSACIQERGAVQADVVNMSSHNSDRNLVGEKNFYCNNRLSSLSKFQYLCQ